ncbi:iron-containing alcohol dehydrogenase family protein [Jeotgalibacillus proteolyticus]|uniref:Oxidoreductase n=1 Tax=Jeotgalibacillus proteolyticus TaxID=2082395 RepID=A0A2S5GDM5_9BACL|nr:iron-containing alcohol dehydrogenase family protein [Jeotgalibacillus proteolyticus]PPA70993.1 oxidoreductase [Jeotgalibacillus proteolyticus]
MEDIIVRGAPAEYVCQQDVLNELESKLAHRKIKKVLLLTGEKSWEAAEPFFPELTGITVVHEVYNGECTLLEIDRTAKLARSEEADAITGVGGGKVLDIVKAAASESGLKSVLIPTLASNCAPWTPLSVIYNEKGIMTHYDVYPMSVDLLLVEPRLLVTAPVSLLVAGIGDTLAKWYEADVQISRLENPSHAIRIAHYTARLCADTMFEHGERAVEDAKNNRVTDSFIKAAEAIIMLGGMVGGYGDKLGRVAGAHSIHNGMTIAPESHQALHGDKVAYGILVQLLLEGKADEAHGLLPFYKKLGLPSSLKDLEIPVEWIQRIAEQATIEKESIHCLRETRITANEVENIMIQLENG